MKLLEPLALGSVTAPNRVLFGPHETNLGAGRAISERHVAYYAERAKGGAGILVSEEASVHASDWPYERAPLAEECGPGWQQLAAVGRRHGTVMLAGLGHAGGQGASAYSQRELWAPSDVPEVNTREVPKIMEADDIAAVVRGFADATRTAVGAGLDGVEINAGQHSLVRQFLSGLTNLRGDDYGTDKLRFAREVLHAVRVEAGDRVVGLRLSCDELAPWAGIVPEAAAEIAVQLLPWIDYLVVVRGAIFSVAATRPDGHDEPGFNLGLVGQIRGAVAGAVPVFAQGSIVDVGQAEWAIDDGRADGVEMTRAQIADPALVHKLAAGAPETIRPCILCNQTCKVRDGRNPIVSCVAEPRAGYELEEPDVTGTARHPLAVHVIGGGVAGLETARVAATRGHRVTLHERDDELGGVLRVAAAGAGRGRLATLADWLEAECRRLDVTIVTGHEIVAGEIGDGLEPVGASGLGAAGAGRGAGTALPDQSPRTHVVIAAGGRTGDHDYEIAGDADVRDVATVLDAIRSTDDPGLPDGPVAIWDPIGGPIAVSAAELLAHRGHDVTLLSPDLIIGTLLSRSGDLAPANVRLEQAGVHLHKRALLRAAHAGEVVVEDKFTGEQTGVKAAVLIDAGQRLPDEALWEATGHRFARAGDAVAPRTVYEAVLEGRRAAFALEGES